MACAQQLARAGHDVVLFEKADRIGGLLRYGIPDFKMEKHHIDRRVEQMRAEGVAFRVNAHVGAMGSNGVSAAGLLAEFDALVVSAGSEHPRDLDVPGRDFDGVHFAMDFLPLQNRRVAGDADVGALSAKGKHVIVIGGGDTGADCVGNALREGARSIVQLELLPEPPPQRPDERTPWPLWPLKYRLSYAMEEARQVGVGEQDYSVTTTHLSADDHGALAALHIAQAAPEPPFAPVEGTERELPAQLVLLAMGFLHPEQELLDQLGVEKDPRGNIRAVSPYTTSVPGVFAAGDARRGQSLIVWAINEGRQCARMVDRFLAEKGGGGEGSLPEDQGCAGHADADEGPEGPPQHVGPGVGAG
jgi:glutamate synthase (NADPH/NADH) small chain